METPPSNSPSERSKSVKVQYSSKSKLKEQRAVEAKDISLDLRRIASLRSFRQSDSATSATSGETSNIAHATRTPERVDPPSSEREDRVTKDGDSEDNVSTGSPGQTDRQICKDASIIPPHVKGLEGSPSTHSLLSNSVSSVGSTTPASIRSNSAQDTDTDASFQVDEHAAARPKRIRQRTTQADRIKILESDTQSGDIEPHQMFCKQCKQWVNLGQKQAYAIKPWQSHRVKCDKLSAGSKQQLLPVDKSPNKENINDGASSGSGRRHSIRSLSRGRSSFAADKSTDDVTQDEAVKDAKEETEVEGQLADGSERSIEMQILALLDADPHVAEVKESDVLCRSCHEWVELSVVQSDILANWRAHRSHCYSAEEIDSITDSERYDYLFNDPQAHIVNPQLIKCLVCQSKVTLAGPGCCNLTNWIAHKAQCHSPLSVDLASAQNSGHGQSSENVLTRETSPFGSSASEKTLVCSSSALLAGHKRSREDESTDDRPRTRARFETPRTLKRHSRWGRVLQPIKAFVHGFYEGLITT